MSKFNIGDWVYGGDWCYGQIVDIEVDSESADVEYTTERGGGCMVFHISDLQHAEPPKEYCSDLEKNEILRDIMDTFERLVTQAKILGFDIRLSPESNDNLRLYYHEDYPNLILVDKGGE